MDGDLLFTRGREYRYYRCPVAWRGGYATATASKLCDARRLPAETADNAVLDAIAGRRLTLRSVDAMETNSTRHRPEERDEPDAVALGHALQRLEQLFVWGHISAEEYLQQRASINSNQLSLRFADRTDADVVLSRDRLAALTSASQRRVVQAVLRRVTVRDGRIQPAGIEWAARA